jgi:N-acetyl-anhydromuramyl-L-alanine amidase AmpD
MKIKGIVTLSILVFIIGVGLGACETWRGGLHLILERGGGKTVHEIIPRHINWGIKVQTNEREISLFVIHTMYNNETTRERRFTLQSVLEILKAYDVAPHYLIARDGRIYQLAPDTHMMQHVGKSKATYPPYREMINDFSLGVELVSAEDTRPTKQQYQALAWLVKKKQRAYPGLRPVGHDAIAWPPGRKSDPWNFDWEYFYQLLKNV